MVRGWIGLGILLIFLALGIYAATAMAEAHLSTGELLEQAAEKAVNGDFNMGVDLGMEAKKLWEKAWNATATLADHSPMDDVDALFAEMEIYAKTEEKPHFAACCKELAQRIRAVADAHRFHWRNLL